jgi:flagellar motor switch protein FliN
MSENEDKKNNNENASFEDPKTEIIKDYSKSTSKPKKKEKEEKTLESILKVKPVSYINDVPLRITAELSRARITMRDLLGYKKNSIIQLEKLAGEPMDVLINDQYVAKGEVVVVNDKYAVRLTDLIEKMEVLNREYNENIT